MQTSQSATSNEILIPKAFSFLRQPRRYKVLYGGRGGAKSHNIARTLLVMGMQRPLRIVCAREIMKSIKDSVHELLSDLVIEYDLRYFYRVIETEIVGKNGTQFKFRGLKHNTEDLKSLEGCDILWVEEAVNVSDKSYEIIIPTVRKDDSEIWVSFNPKNATDPTWQRFILDADEDVIYKKVSWRDNPFFPKVLEKERLKLLKNDPEAYKHVWEGEFDTRYSGAVYAKFVNQERISDMVRHDPNYPVYTAWDKGYGDATAIVFYQIGNNEVFIIDYFEDNQEDTKYYCEVLSGKKIIVDQRDLETGDILQWSYGEDLEQHSHRKVYNYHAHYVPHDAGIKLLEASGRSMVDQARKLGVRMSIIPATAHLNSEEALRVTLRKTWMNKDRTKDLVQSLLSYHYEYDEDRKRYSKLPYHDWSSNACDAAEIMARTCQDKAITQKALNDKRVVAKFHKLRQDNNLNQQDPYRTKPSGKRR